MLPELLHAKYRGNNTTYLLKHEKRHKSQRQNYDGLHDHDIKKCLKKEEKLFLELGTKT